jgi:hypothetical protein
MQHVVALKINPENYQKLNFAAASGDAGGGDLDAT